MTPTITAADAWQCPACDRWNAGARSVCVCGNPAPTRFGGTGLCAHQQVAACCPACNPPPRQSPSEAPPARREAIPRVQTRKPRDRTPRPGTKAEAEWIEIVRRAYPGAAITPHGLTFTLPDGDRYTVDLLVSMPDMGVAYEVKGGYRGPGWEQGMERYKRAKAAFPWLDLRLAEKRDGLWYVDGARMEA